MVTQLEHDREIGRLGDGDAAVIETYVETGSFDHARQAYRERVETEQPL